MDSSSTSLSSLFAYTVLIVFRASSCQDLLQSLPDLVASLFSWSNPLNNLRSGHSLWSNFTLRKGWRWDNTWWSAQLPIAHSVVNANWNPKCSSLLHKYNLINTMHSQSISQSMGSQMMHSSGCTLSQCTPSNIFPFQMINPQSMPSMQSSRCSPVNAVQSTQPGWCNSVDTGLKCNRNHAFCTIEPT